MQLQTTKIHLTPNDADRNKGGTINIHKVTHKDAIKKERKKKRKTFFPLGNPC